MKVVYSVLFVFTLTFSYGQSLLTDSITGCKYLLPWDCAPCSLSWTSDCLDNLPEGNGVLTVSYGDQQIMRYQGSMKNGKLDGFGHYVDSQNKLNGYFKNDAFLGSDTLAINFIEEFEKNTIAIVDSKDIYVSDGDSKELFYYALSPKNSIEGVLILFPPTWQSTENVIIHNMELIKKAEAKNLLLIVPSINYNLCLGATTMTFLNTAFEDMLQKYNPPKEKIVLGGFSLGGMNAIRYTEMAYENDSATAIKPAAVYGVDPPLDLARLYASFKNTIEKNFSQPAINEANVYIEKLNHQFGGPPNEFPDKYVQHSMYSKSKKDGGNAKFLSTVPVRIYSDPDIDWYLKNRHMDMYNMNALDQTAMICLLNLMGNNDAEYINALGKGYRLNGTRQPHSWSLVEPGECISWISNCLK
jgi:hypothetical protein